MYIEIKLTDTLILSNLAIVETVLGVRKKCGYDLRPISNLFRFYFRWPPIQFGLFLEHQYLKNNVKMGFKYFCFLELPPFLSFHTLVI